MNFSRQPNLHSEKKKKKGEKKSNKKKKKHLWWLVAINQIKLVNTVNERNVP